MDNKKLAELLFSDIKTVPTDMEALFPKRNLPDGAKVTRLGPSPTGFIHLGNLYGAFTDERLAHQSDGVFYLRIEDTDDKRFVEGAVDTVITSLEFFGIKFDEGAGKNKDNGEYGPYFQSKRKQIYQTYVKDLVERGLAYPCFLTSEEIDEIRAIQEAGKKTPGIYGEYAKFRNLGFDEAEKNIVAGKPYVIRLRSGGNPNNPKEISVEDAVRGTLRMPENFQDIVILKNNGIPTYHFAHAVDDHLMRTTHVVRGEEWLSSLPIHIELFNKLGFEVPIYCHTAVLMKMDNGNRRKLSKRKDPELSLDFYREVGYHPIAVREYLLTILNSNYEEWRIANPDAPAEEFEFTTEKMSTSGALFDLSKLNDVSKNTLIKISASDLYDFLLKWSEEFNHEFFDLIKVRKDYLLKILDLDRTGNKPRKDFVSASQIFDFISYFFDEYFSVEDEMPQETQDDVKTILSEYLKTYNQSDDPETWFGKIREISVALGYAAKPKDFKKNPDTYKGHVGHVSTVIRIALTGRKQSPDIWQIQQILGEEKTKSRISAFL